MSLCDQRCRKCIYGGTVSGGGVVCDYLLITGNRRRCPAGKKCERYVRGNRLSTIDNSIFRGTTPKPKRKRDQAAYKRKYRALIQSQLRGLQKAAIREYCERTGSTYSDIGRLIGVSQTTVSGWAKEYGPANWDKLAKLGIEKPDFPGEVSE